MVERNAVTRAELVKAVKEITDSIPLGYMNGRVLACRDTPESDIVEWLAKIYALKEKVRDL